MVARAYRSSSEDGRVVLHSLLHLQPQLGGGDGTVGEPDFVQVCNRSLASIGRKAGQLVTW